MFKPVGSKNESFIDHLSAQIKKKGEFPVISPVALQLLKNCKHTEEGITLDELANIILKDLGLTQRILKIVNSTFYASFQMGGKIESISRATFILGYEKVINLAVAASVYETIESAKLPMEVKNLLVYSLLCGIISRKIAENHENEEPELLYICGVFRNIGKILVGFYDTDQYKHINTILNESTVGESELSRQTLGVSYDEIGNYFARKWNFPDEILWSMKRFTAEESVKHQRREIEMNGYVNFSYDLCYMIENVKRDPALINTIFSSYEENAPLSSDDMLKVLTAAYEEIQTVSASLGVDIHKLTMISEFNHLLVQSDLFQEPESLIPSYDSSLSGKASVSDSTADKTADQPGIPSTTPYYENSLDKTLAVTINKIASQEQRALDSTQQLDIGATQLVEMQPKQPDNIPLERKIASELNKYANIIQPTNKQTNKQTNVPPAGSTTKQDDKADSDTSVKETKSAKTSDIRTIITPVQRTSEISKIAKKVLKTTDEILEESITEIAAMLVNSQDLSLILKKIVRALFKGLKADRSILCLQSGKGNEMQAVLGYGNDVKSILPDFKFKTAQGEDIFNVAITKNKSIIIKHTNDPRYVSYIPKWYKELLRSYSFMLLPIVVNNRVLCLIYIDNERHEEVKITPEQSKQIRTLCNQAASAFTLKSKAGQRDDAEKTREGSKDNWLERLKLAMEKGTIVPFYQPIRSNSSGVITYYESLARIMEGDNIVMPGQFLKPAKQLGMIHLVTRSIVKKSIDTFKPLNQKFSFNATNEDFKEGSLIDFLSKNIKASDIKPQQIIIEVQENILIDNSTSVQDQISALKQMGLSIAIDRFGEIRTNLDILYDYIADYIKIDGRIIKTINEDNKNYMIARGIVDISRPLGYKIVAEFVHNKGVYDKVVELGIDYSQGYYIGAPTVDITG